MMKKIFYAIILAVLTAGAILAFSADYNTAAVQYNAQRSSANIAQQNANGISQQPVPPSKPPAQPAQQTAAQPAAAKVDDVVVTADRMPEEIAMVARNIDVIKAADIKGSGMQNIADILGTINGITIQQNGGYQGLSDVLTRGAPSNETLVMIDNVPINDIMTGGADLTMLDAAMIQRLEVIKGGLSSVYGADASAGVINLITGSKEPKPFSGMAEYGSFNYQKYNVGSDYKILGITYDASAVEERSDGYVANSDFMKREGNLKLQFKGDMLDSTLTGFYFKRTMGVAFGPSGPDLYSRETDENYNLGIDEKFNLGPLKGTVSGYIRSADLAYQDPLYGSDSRDIKKDYESNVMFSYDEGGGISMVTGYESDLKDIKSTEIAGEKTLSNQASSTSLAGKFLGDTLLVNGGFRADFNSAYGNTTSEDLAIKYKLPDSVELRAMFDKSFSAPTLGDLYTYEPGPSGPYYYIVEGNQNLKTENSTDYEVSISKKDAGVKESMTFFKNDIDNLIAWETTPDYVTTMPVNIDRASITGAEAKLEVSVSDYLTFNAGYTYMNAVDSITKEPLAYRPANEADAGLTITFPFKTKISVNGRYEDIRYYSQAELKPYYLVNASISQYFSKNITLHFNMDNVLNNTTYQVVNNYVMPGRTINGGMSVEF